MMKKIVSLLLAAMLLCALLPTAFAQREPGDLNDYATGNFNKKYDVYSGPGKEYYQVDDTIYQLKIEDGKPLFEVLGQLYNY